MRLFGPATQEEPQITQMDADIEHHPPNLPCLYGLTAMRLNGGMSVRRTAVGGRVVEPVEPSALPGAIFRIVGGKSNQREKGRSQQCGRWLLILGGETGRRAQFGRGRGLGRGKRKRARG